MAKIVPSGLIQDIEGSIGAYTFAGWKGLHYIRLKSASISNPNTSLQRKMRGSLAYLVHRWWSLTPVQRALWSDYAQALGSARADEQQEGYGGIIPVRGKIMTGYNAFVSVNQYLTAVNGVWVDVPPIDPPIGCKIVEAWFNLDAPPLKIETFVESVGPVPKSSCVQLWFAPSGKFFHGSVAHPYVMEFSGFYSKGTVIDYSPWTEDFRVGHDRYIGYVPWDDYADYMTAHYGEYVGLLQARLIDKEGGVGPPSNVRALYFVLAPP